jgi:hypothetical protein
MYCTLARDMTVAKDNDLSVCRASHASKVDKSRSEKLRGSKSIMTISNIDQRTQAAENTARSSFPVHTSPAKVVVVPETSTSLIKPKLQPPKKTVSRRRRRRR